jgi:hypothetical protein
MFCRFYRDGFWVRVTRHGYGLSVTTGRPLFSERSGHRKVLRIFGVGFEVLKPYTGRRTGGGQ